MPGLSSGRSGILSPPYNFVSQPLVEDRDPLWQNPELAEQVERGVFFLGRADVKQRETLITGTMRGESEYIAVLPGNTTIPLVAAALISLVFIGLLAKAYWLAAMGAMLSAGALLFWAWQGGARSDLGRVDAGCGHRLPFHYSSVRSPGWWGMLITLLADATLFFSLVFAYFFLWAVSPAWPPDGYRNVGLLLPSLGMAALMAGSAAIYWGESGNGAGDGGRLRIGYLIAIGCAIGFVIAQAIALETSGISAKAHAYGGALVYTITGFEVAHVAIAILMAGFVVLRSRFGYISRQRPVEPQVAALFWHYTVLQWLAGFQRFICFRF